MTKNLIIKAEVLIVILFSCVNVFFSPLISSGIETSDPHLVFKKSVVVKKYKDGQAFTEPHTVKKGEYIWKILREHYKLSNSRIVFYCKIAKAVNPDIKDIDRISPNQKILVPFQYTKGVKNDFVSDNDTVSGVEYVVRHGDHFAKILRDIYNLPERIIFSNSTRRLFKEANPAISNLNRLEKGQKIIIPAEIYSIKKHVQEGSSIRDRAAKALEKRTGISADPGSEEETRINDMISTFIHSFNGSDNRTGEDVIRLEGSSSIKIDYSRFPLYELPWGRKILLDYGNRMPRGIKQVITSEWEDAEVVAVRKKDDLELILGKVLDVCGFYNIEKGGEYIVNRDSIQVRVSSDWIVFKDNTLKNVFAINLIDEDEAIDSALSTYLSGMGLQVVDIKYASADTEKKTDHGSKAGWRKVQADPMVLTDLILDILGRKYYKNHKTNIYQNMYRGFSLEVVADRMFERDGSTFLIDFRDLPGKICEIITEQGIHLLKINLQEDEISETVKQLLEFCGATYKDSPAEFKYRRGKKSIIQITIPGFLIEGLSGEVLLTQAGLQAPVKQFLLDKEVEIVQY